MNDHVPDQQQVGWNAGYLAGEAERLALATECDRLRWELGELWRRVDDGHRPHRQPKGMAQEGGDVLAWICQACGEVVSETKPTGSLCPIDWRRGPTT